MQELFYDQAEATVLSDGFVLETTTSLDHEFGTISYQESGLGIGSVLISNAFVKGRRICAVSWCGYCC
ncbi:hypothetical protein [Pedobacter sp. FW305-3-2-15-E-R2A2]|uniref:hypothetical protein n=1 Tax=Pedobacter sp. FW305-3-2-15-E-R2A2 TaxID=3140251 RepID=UPI003140692A